ncbi:MAG: hypothetical protein IJS54_03060 [Desulfovibrio sp.]|nr:hypothetical protein [Desulfovibrio sp.]
MEFKNRIKRLSDILEKLGVAGLAIWLFRGDNPPLEMLLVSVVSVPISTLLTREDA